MMKKSELNGRQENNKQNDALAASAEMCLHCFDVILADLMGKNVTDWNLESIPATSTCPLFVTWDKKSGEQYHLRGCIGTLAPRQLRVAIGEYARTSAFRDHRFRSISLDEVQDLRVGVSLLVNHEDCEDCLDWVVGFHGIVIHFDHDSKHYSATFLPEVAAEQGWTQKEAIRSLVHKAGHRHNLTNELLSKISCTRYQSSKIQLNYVEYVSRLGKNPIQDVENTSNKKNWRNFFSS
mmetsp:Transcript_12077/g.14037  ORF Transcript_12077/g.14037 Transcript_12077/m.14037 type:complete len:237 (+) Transcript_12077:61-771(+)